MRSWFGSVNNLILALGLSVSTLLVGSEEGDGATSASLLVVGAGWWQGYFCLNGLCAIGTLLRAVFICTFLILISGLFRKPFSYVCLYGC